MTLISRIRDVFGIEVETDVPFDAPRVRDLALRIREGLTGRPALTARTDADSLPISFEQRRLWVLEQVGSSRTAYSAVGAVRLLGELNVGALERSVRTILSRHESLRTRFEEVDGEPVQVIDPAAGWRLSVEDLGGLSSSARAERVSSAMDEEAATPFDLSMGPVFRIRLLRLGDAEHVLLRTFHHIVTDAWSEGVFNRELSVLYAAYRSGGEDPLPGLPVQYADFALWQRRCLSEGSGSEGLTYWREQLSGAPAQLRLPTRRGASCAPDVCGGGS